MTASVVELSAVRCEPVPSIVSLLEDVLEQAKRGEIVSVAIATENRLQCLGTGFSVGAGGDHGRLLGALSQLAYRVNKTFHETP